MSEYVGFGWRDRNAKKASGRAPDPLSGNSAGALPLSCTRSETHLFQASHFAHPYLQCSCEERHDVALGWGRLLLRYGLAHVSQGQRVRDIFASACLRIARS